MGATPKNGDIPKNWDIPQFPHPQPGTVFATGCGNRGVSPFIAGYSSPRMSACPKSPPANVAGAPA